MQTQKREAAHAPATNTRRWVLGLAAVAMVVGATVLLMRDSGGTEPDLASGLRLSLGESNVLATCLPFEVATLADMPVAFLGTATSVDGSTVTLSVDRWFTESDAVVVHLVGEHQSPALIAGFEFTPGDQYLISATDGSVNYCGYSGAATPELLAGFEAAFAA